MEPMLASRGPYQERRHKYFYINSPRNLTRDNLPNFFGAWNVLGVGVFREPKSKETLDFKN